MPVPFHIKEMLEKQSFRSSHLALPSCGITDDEISPLIDLMIDNNPRITSFDLTNNAISRAGAKRLLEIPWLKELNLSSNRLGFDDEGSALGFKEALRGNKSLQSLNLSSNYLVQPDIDEVLQIATNTKCKKVIIENSKNLPVNPALSTEPLSAQLPMINSTRIAGHPGLSMYDDVHVERISSAPQSK